MAWFPGSRYFLIFHSSWRRATRMLVPSLWLLTRVTLLLLTYQTCRTSKLSSRARLRLVRRLRLQLQFRRSICRRTFIILIKVPSTVLAPTRWRWRLRTVVGRPFLRRKMLISRTLIFLSVFGLTRRCVSVVSSQSLKNITSVFLFRSIPVRPGQIVLT